MRYRLGLLALTAVLSVMNVLIGPATAPAIPDSGAPANGIDLMTEPDPTPYAILDIGLPPKGKSAEEYSKDLIYRLTNPRGFIWYAGACAEVIRLPSVAPTKNASSWLAKNIRVSEEDGGRRLCLTIGAGTHSEQVAAINTLLRTYFREGEASSRSITFLEECLRSRVEMKPLTTALMRMERDPNRLKRMHKREETAKVAEAELRAEIARRKQVAVIKWAK